jgi:hemoglobin
MTEEKITPYRTTAIFDEHTLPAALQGEHSLKASAWGIIRVLEGRLRYIIIESDTESILAPGQPGLVRPEQLHRVEPIGPVRLQIEFYDREPPLQ